MKSSLKYHELPPEDRKGLKAKEIGTVGEEGWVCYYWCPLCGARLVEASNGEDTCLTCLSEC